MDQSTGFVDVYESVAISDYVSSYPPQKGVFVALEEIMTGFLGGVSGEQGMIDTRTTGLSPS